MDKTRPQLNTVIFDKRIMHYFGQTRFVLYRNDGSSLTTSPLSTCRPPLNVDNHCSRKMENPSPSYPPGALSRTLLSNRLSIVFQDHRRTRQFHTRTGVSVNELTEIDPTLGYISFAPLSYSGLFHATRYAVRRADTLSPYPIIIIQFYFRQYIYIHTYIHVQCVHIVK